MRHDPRLSYQGQSCRKINCMHAKPSFVRQTQVVRNGVLGLLLSLALGQMIWAGTSVSSPSQTLILHPASAPALRIDFNYNSQNALPPFQKEPVLPGKEVARGLIPTVPPTPLLRNINDNELYLNTDHTRDLVNGKRPPTAAPIAGTSSSPTLASPAFGKGWRSRTRSIWSPTSTGARDG